MKYAAVAIIAALLAAGCSDTRRIQSDVYHSLTKSFRLPESEGERIAFYQALIAHGKFPSDSKVLSYELVTVPIRKTEKDFYDSVVLIRKANIRSPDGALYVLEEELYGIAGFGSPQTIRRRIFDTKLKRTTLEEYYPE